MVSRPAAVSSCPSLNHSPHSAARRTTRTTSHTELCILTLMSPDADPGTGPRGLFYGASASHPQSASWAESQLGNWESTLSDLSVWPFWDCSYKPSMCTGILPLPPAWDPGQCPS